MPYELFPFDPHFAGGVASFFTEKSQLRRRVLETAETIAIGDVTFYEPPEAAADGRACSPLATLAAARGDEGRLARLNGDFAAAVFERNSGGLTLIRDHCGVVPLHYSGHGAACAFSSLVRPLLEAPWATEELDEIALATYLVLMAPGRERTYFTCAKTVLPASRVVVGGGGPVVSRKYWLPHPAPGLELRTAEEACEAVREQLVRAVVSRAKDVDNVGIKLSGGLDSSTIAGILCSKFPNRTFQAVSGALPLGSTNPKGDEREYIEETKKLYPNLCVTYETADGVGAFEGAGYWSTWLASPVANEYWYLESSIARRAANLGIRYFFSGYGGDQCVSTKGGAFLAEALFGFRLGLFFREFRRLSANRDLGVFSAIRYLVLPLVVPSPFRRLISRWRHGPWYKSTALAPPQWRNSVLQEHLAKCGYFPVREPLRSFRSNEQGGVRSFDLIAPSVDRTTSAPFGISARFPLVDPRLIETCIAVSWEYKVSEKLDRVLFRNAARPFLPTRIAERLGKSYVSPDFEERLHRIEAQVGLIADYASRSGALTKLFNPGRIRAAVGLMQQAESSRRDIRLITEIVLPCRLAEFLAEIEN